MFCKWCGADLPNSAKKCTRCGRDVPAMSDCGGFYDLVPDARGRSVAAPGAVPPICEAPPKNDPPKKDAPTKSKSSRRGNGLHLLISCVGLVVVIALLLCMNSKLGKALDAAAQNGERLEAISEELLQVEEALQQKPSEELTPPADSEMVPEDILLEEQAAKIEITVEHSEEVSSVKTVADLGDFESAVVDQVMFDSTTHAFSGVQIDLGESEQCITIHIDSKVPATSVGMGLISAQLKIDEKIFAQAQDDAEYEWEYRIGGTAQWAPLDQKVFKVSQDGTTVTYTAGDLAELLKDAQAAEFRLTYKRSNVSGGSLTIIVSGITAENQLPEI